MVKQMIQKTPGHYLHTQAFFKEAKMKAVKSKMTRMIHNLSKIYPPAVFPKVYLVPGILNGNGTQTEIGLFVAAEMFVKTENMSGDGLTN